MEYLTPEDNYLVVLPGGKAITFKDIEECDAYINRYYEKRVSLHTNEIYENYDLTQQDARDIIGTILGAEEGDAKVYYLDDVFEAIQNSGAFIEEQQEVISKLLGRNSRIDTTHFGLDEMLVNIPDIIEGRF
ncbi:hypothetical protein UT300003_16070 [Clostridium sardiniense]|uniref:hypothetical protein n=1 Tax=Clostridium sardiniense TaxID=29369 RepID=UPI0019594528|nr:hypothetical protein [Clostridium sardiniense]MBM7834626.1 hypothetical protein [Clostridium sardiniense]